MNLSETLIKTAGILDGLDGVELPKSFDDIRDPLVKSVVDTAPGVLLGAGVGALADKKHRLRGAAIGGLGGGALAYGLGTQGHGVGQMLAAADIAARRAARRVANTQAEISQLTADADTGWGWKFASIIDSLPDSIDDIRDPLVKSVIDAAPGVLLGAGVGALADKKHRLRGAAIGGLGGGALAYGLGTQGHGVGQMLAAADIAARKAARRAANAQAELAEAAEEEVYRAPPISFGRNF